MGLVIKCDGWEYSLSNNRWSNALDESDRLKKNAYMREWKRKNKDKVNKINLTTRERNRPKYNAINQKSLRKRRKEVPELFSGYKKVYREKYPNKVRDSYKEWYDKNGAASARRRAAIKKETHPFYHLFYGAKSRARKFGIEFSLCREDIIIPEKCPILGIKFKRGTGGFCPESPSIDRINPSAGYTKSNIKIISWRANRLKSDASIEEVEAILAYMKQESVI